MTAYYNEIDPLKAEVLREAIKANAIAPGDVDERSIVNVEPDDLVGFTQCHFFAGGGFWSLALRQAGWGDDREVWTGSCPCPSFSAAGKGKGFDDPRHLWPDWMRLIRQRRPSTIFGEQVSAAIGHGWLDLVQTDLEAQDYAVGKIVLGACSVGAPHIRQRLFFVGEKQQGSGNSGQGSVKFLGDAAQRGFRIAGSAPGRGGHIDGADEFGWLGEPSQPRLEGHAGDGRDGSEPGRQRKDEAGPVAETGGVGGMADADGGNSGDRRIQRSRQQRFEPQDGGVGSVDNSRRNGWRAGWNNDRSNDRLQSDAEGVFGWPGALNGFWRDADWIGCRDGKWRPVEPGTFPLAHGSAARVGRLRLYGDAICVPAARAFIEAYLEAVKK